MRRAWQRLRQVGRRAADYFPLTPLGVLLTLGAAVALDRLAYGQLDLVQLVVGYGALGVGGLALVVVGLTTVGLKLAIRPVERTEPLELETGHPATTGFSLPGLRFLPLVQVRWEWEEGASGARVEQRARRRRLHEEVTLFDRGEIEGIRRRVVVQDAFGLVRLAIRARDPLTLRVVPRVGALGKMPVLQSFAGGEEHPHPMGLEDGDRMELRRYVPGDPARFIHWKVFGRTRRLVVRVPERALSRARRVVAYQVAGADDDATAGAARVAVQTGALGGDWTFSADGTEQDARNVADALERIVRSVEARHRGAAGLRDFLARAERQGPASAVVFAPPSFGPWVERVVAVGRARQGRMRVVIAVDGLRAMDASPWWRRLIVSDPPAEGAPVAELEGVVRALEGVGCEVVLLDRVTGRQLGHAHLAAVRARSAPRGAGRPSEPAPQTPERHAA
ncbi:MAG: DUF58 domain-containing protein [Myxococcota bacterium]